MNDDLTPLAGFNSTARLFPLPNLVFFPQVVQPLHIFEPRYRQMTADALDGDRLIALVLPKPGVEADQSHSPPVHAVACLGKIIANQKLDDGRYNLLLRGLSRIQIIREIPHGKLYRKAKAELLVEVHPLDNTVERRLRRRLAKVLPAWVEGKGPLLTQFRKLMKTDLLLGTLLDIVAFALPLEAEFKQSLLDELEVEARADSLLKCLEARKVKPKRSLPFPPEFSVN